MKKITSLQYRKTAERRIQLKAGTGSHCPTNGFWRPEDGPASEPVFVFEGSIKTKRILLDPGQTVIPCVPRMLHSDDLYSNQ